MQKHHIFENLRRTAIPYHITAHSHDNGSNAIKFCIFKQFF